MAIGHGSTYSSTFLGAYVVDPGVLNYRGPAPYSLAMGRTASNKTLGLILSAVYLNLTLHKADGSEERKEQYLGMPGMFWPELLTRLAIGYFHRYGENTGLDGNDQRYLGSDKDLLARKNTQDLTNSFGGNLEYGRGGVAGGGYRKVVGRNKGHSLSGFSTSYRRNESGDRLSYHDDGLDQEGRLNYGAQDVRFRNQGGVQGAGNFHHTNLNQPGSEGANQLADWLYGLGAGGRGVRVLPHTHIKEALELPAQVLEPPVRELEPPAQLFRPPADFGLGERAGRVLPSPSSAAPPLDWVSGGGRTRIPPPRPKKTGLYSIPMPSNLYFDTTPAPN